MYNEMMDTIGLVNTVDPELAAAMDRELNRQRQNIELIASENIFSVNCFYFCPKLLCKTNI